MALKFYADMGPNNPRFHCSDARRFSAYVNNVQFWFAVHRPVNCQAGLTVSHWHSGARVCDITPTSIAAGAGMSWPELARAAIARLCEEKTTARVYDVLRRAEGA